MPEKWWNFQFQNGLHRERSRAKIETDKQVLVWLNGRPWRRLQHTTAVQLGHACGLCQALLRDDNYLPLEFQDERMDESTLNLLFDLLDRGQTTVLASDLSPLLSAMDFFHLEPTLLTDFLQTARDHTTLSRWMELYLELGEPLQMGELLDYEMVQNECLFLKCCNFTEKK